MPSPQPEAPKSSHRIWLIAAGVLVALAVIPLLRPSAPSRETHIESAHTAHSPVIPEPSKTQRPTKDKRDDAPPPAFPSRTWIVPADFDVLLANHGRKNLAESDPFAPDAGVESQSIPRGHLYIQETIMDCGIRFPPGTSATLDITTGILEVHNHAESLQIIDELIAAIGPMDLWVMDPTLFQTKAPPPDPRIKTNREKLKNIIIPEVNFQNTTFGEAVEYLQKRSLELDPEELGIRIHIKNPPPQPADSRDEALDQEAGLGDTSIHSAVIRNLQLRNVPLATVLQYMTGTSRIRYRIDAEGVTVLSIMERDLLTRRWHVDPVLIKRFRELPHFSGGGDIDPFAPDDTPPALAKEQWLARQEKMPLIDLCKDSGISFPPDAQIRHTPASGELTITNTPDNLELAQRLFTWLALKESKARAGF